MTADPPTAPGGRIVLASQIHRTPVVTFGGEDIAQIRDIVYAGDGGRIAGFTLAGRGLLSGPMKVALPWQAVVGLGPDAVIVRDADVLVATGEVFEQARSSSGPGRGDVLGSQVLTDDGAALGVVTDVVVRIPPPGEPGDPGDPGRAVSGRHAGPGGGFPEADVIGYAIGPAGKSRRGGPAQFVPLPETLSASGQHLIVPARIRHYLTDDLSRLGANVEAFRRDTAGAGHREVFPRGTAEGAAGEPFPRGRAEGVAGEPFPRGTAEGVAGEPFPRGTAEGGQGDA